MTLAPRAQPPRAQPPRAQPPRAQPPRAHSLAQTRRVAEIAGYVWRTSRRVDAIKRKAPGADRESLRLVEDTAKAGVVFVKMSQFVSARGDVLDPDTVAALERLQNSVPCDVAPPVVPGYDIEPKSIASASVASVFRGRRVSDGKVVAVKRVKDSAKRDIAADLPILISVLGFAKMIDVPGAANMLEIVRECAPMLLAELDLRVEAKAQAAFRRKLRDVEWLRVPAVLEASEDHMVSEYVESRKVNDAMPTKVLAERLFELYVRMILDLGMIHADPHAGNVGVRSDGVVVLYDFGATVDVRDARPHIARLVKCAVADDVDGAVRTLGDMGIIKPDPVTGARLRRAMPKLRALSKSKDFNSDLGALSEFTSNEDRLFELTTRYVYLIRSLVIVQGIIAYHDPGFDLATYVAANGAVSEAAEIPPWDVAREFASDLFSAPTELRGVRDSVSDMSFTMNAEIQAAKAALKIATAWLGADVLLRVVAALWK